MTNKRYWIPCECGSEGLLIERDEDDGDIYFALWVCNHGDMGIIHKLRWIWRIINGRPWADNIVIDNSRIPHIIDALEDLMCIDLLDDPRDDMRGIMGCGSDTIKTLCEVCPYKDDPDICVGIREANSWKVFCD